MIEVSGFAVVFAVIGVMWFAGVVGLGATLLVVARSYKARVEFFEEPSNSWKSFWEFFYYLVYFPLTLPMWYLRKIDGLYEKHLKEEAEYKVQVLNSFKKG